MLCCALIPLFIRTHTFHNLLCRFSIPAVCAGDSSAGRTTQYHTSSVWLPSLQWVRGAYSKFMRVILLAFSFFLSCWLSSGDQRRRNMSQPGGAENFWFWNLGALHIYSSTVQHWYSVGHSLSPTLQSKVTIKSLNPHKVRWAIFPPFSPPSLPSLPLSLLTELPYVPPWSPYSCSYWLLWLSS